MRIEPIKRVALQRTIALLLFLIVAYILFFKIIPKKLYFLNVTGFVLVLTIGFYFIIYGWLSSIFFTKTERKHKNNLLANANIGKIVSAKDNLQLDKQDKMDVLIERDNYRKEFMGNVSHELKTPLFTVQGYLLTLADGAIEDKSVRKNYINRALKGVDRLMEIVEDLNTISKLEEGNLVLKKEKWNIVSLLKVVMSGLELKAKKRDIILQFDKTYPLPIFVVIDKKRIQQVCVNLIENAIKYNKNGGVVEVGIRRLEDKIIVQVKDEGEGIPDENLPRIFERFYRIDTARARSQGGSGLGLTIVKHILEAHNEKITVASEPKKGTTFSFTLTPKLY
ncbi:MAG: two-component sensor histidine kinase [Flavobacteriales bacterium]|nr:MAG: two-component sensor histidine kinase [Flavobacteriales bacterium]